MKTEYHVREGLEPARLVQMLNMPRAWARFPHVVLVREHAPQEPLGVMVLMPAPERVAVLDCRMNPAYHARAALSPLVDAVVARARRLNATALSLNQPLDRRCTLASVLESRGFGVDAEFRTFVAPIERARVRTASIVARAQALKGPWGALELKSLSDALIPEVRALVAANALLSSTEFDGLLSGSSARVVVKALSSIGMCKKALVGLMLVAVNPADETPTPEVVALWVAPALRATGLHAGLIHHSIEQGARLTPEYKEFAFSAGDDNQRQTSVFARRIGARADTSRVRYSLSLD